MSEHGSGNPWLCAVRDGDRALRHCLERARHRWRAVSRRQRASNPKPSAAPFPERLRDDAPASRAAHDRGHRRAACRRAPGFERSGPRLRRPCRTSIAASTMSRAPFRAGSTLSYGEVAERLGDRNLARDVAQALGQNPFPIIVPCHRVMAAGGKTGGFSAPGGVRTKLRLLSIERAQPGGPTLVCRSAARDAAAPARLDPDHPLSAASTRAPMSCKYYLHELVEGR